MNIRLTIFLLTIISFFPAACIAQSNTTPEIDSLIRISYTTPDDTSKALLLAKIAFRFSTVNPAEGMSYAERSLKLADSLLWKKGIAAAYNSKGLNYMAVADYKTANRYFKKSLSLNKKISNELGIAINYRNLGILFQHRQDYYSAIKNGFNSIKHYQNIQNKNGISAGYCNLGNIYLDLEQYPKARDYFLLALEANGQSGNKYDLAIIQNNISYANRMLGYLPKARQAGIAALDLSKALNDRFLLSVSYSNIGLLATDQKDYPTARLYLDSSLNIAKESNLKSRIELAYGNIGRNYLAAAEKAIEVKADSASSPGTVENLYKAREYLTMAAGAAFEINERIDLMNHYLLLSKADSLLHDKVQADKHYRLYQVIERSIFSAKNRQTIGTAEEEGKEKIK
jgi:tetratricopeptide (TPR) repeat protein